MGFKKINIFASIVCTAMCLLLSFSAGAQGGGGNGLDTNPPPPVPPPPPGLPIDDAIPFAVAVALLIGVRKKIQDIRKANA